ncbi:hypothetical protein TIFTF001_003869 [Ficus carica]|uniref:Uncharacterized protein n=1 Tax=Ficus carica TaxID=3494 RepID=A0AA87ZFG2_FICCA|nr:hypothetical protein TIFTF001_003869 [Ficus carica]
MTSPSPPEARDPGNEPASLTSSPRRASHPLARSRPTQDRPLRATLQKMSPSPPDPGNRPFPNLAGVEPSTRTPLPTFHR